MKATNNKAMGGLEEKMEGKTSGFSRRKFLTASAAGIVSAGMAGLSPAISVANELEKSSGDILYRELGKTGLKVPVITHGCGACNDASVIQAAYDMGARMFDTAASYQNGANEMLVGSVLKKMGVRDKSFINTKIYNSAQRRDESPEKIIEKIATQAEASLKRLRTDYVDILLVHGVATTDIVKNQAIIKGMQELKKQGKAKHIGFSTHANMTEVINAGADSGAWDVILTTYNFTLASDDKFIAAVDNAASKGIGIIGMKTLAFNAQWPSPDSKTEFSTEIATTALMKWALNNKSIATIMVAFNNMEHMAIDFPVAKDIAFNSDEKKLLTENNIELSMGSCFQCCECLASCPKGADIPTLMRTNMYATKYVDFNLAQAALDEIETNRGLEACGLCDKCVAQCVNTVDIKSRIGELKAIYA